PQQIFAVTPAQVADLEAGKYYFNVHTPANPGGEIRGQILINHPGPEHFAARLTGHQETPPHAVAGRGSGSVTLNADETMITVNLSWSGLTGPALAAHIHGPAGPGVAAPVMFPFTGVPAATAGHIPRQSFSVTPQQVAELETGLLYFNIHTAAHPAGEIRGQIFRVVEGSE
ncbi:MAG TPA: CHRD domain-containing protein, partial [Acidimicrobiales bacterium]|nr:CHRD domain-containing protein [Acidimicrobiales bacterium]